MIDPETLWLSDYDIIEKLEHIDGITLKEYYKIPHFLRISYFNLYDWINKKHLCAYDSKKKPLYFFDNSNFKFKVFITYKHFICIVKYDNVIEYFNPNHSMKDYDFRKLKQIVKPKKYKLIKNEIKLQNNKYSCGRWCILRCLLYHKSLLEFYDILDENKNKYPFLKDYDDVCDFILFKYYGIRF